MTPKPNRDRESQQIREAGIDPKWDFLVLSCLSLLTILALLFALKSAGHGFVNRQGSLQTCMIVSDPTTGWRGIPNATCAFKGIEHQLVTYSFNRCGDYTSLDCDAKTPGAYRIVLVGSSYGFGWGVQKDQSFAALLPRELSARTGRKIELYNQSMVAASTGAIARRVDEAVAAKPDMILWALSPQDIAYNSYSPQKPTQERAIEHKAVDPRSVDHAAPLKEELNAFLSASSPLAYIRERWGTTSFGLVLQHYLFQSRTLYVKLYLMSGDRAGFLQHQFTPAWQGKLSLLDQDMARAATAAQKAGVPLVVTLLPDRILSTVVSMNQPPAGVDGYELDQHLQAVAWRHGAVFVDVLPGFHQITNPQLLYMPVDDHPYASGHQVIANLLADDLTRLIPARSSERQVSVLAKPSSRR